MPQLAAESGWDSNYLYSRHSLPATGAATRLHPAKIIIYQIKKTTGHKSDAGLSKYQRSGEKNSVEYPIS